MTEKPNRFQERRKKLLEQGAKTSPEETVSTTPKGIYRGLDKMFKEDKPSYKTNGKKQP